jgi:pimeloyl-[acyl-carrier protein] methyl ester esterase
VGNGPDLWLVHGWAMHGGVFLELAALLAERHRVHAVDLPGHGASRAQRFDLAMLADGLAARMREPAWVLGWSLGALVTQQLALTHAAKVRGMVLMAGTPCFVAREDWAHGVSPAVLEEFARGLEQDVRGVLARFIALQGLGQPSALKSIAGPSQDRLGPAEAGSTVRSRRGNANLAALRAAVLDAPMPSGDTLRDGLALLRAADLRAHAPRLVQPTLVIHGERDRVAPPDAGRWLARSLPNARLAILDDAGHAPFVGQAERVARLIAEFAHGEACP